MNASIRRVVPEVLDALHADDPMARRSRLDLQRIHSAMRSVPILRRAIAGLRLAVQPRRILELGAGDGTLLLRFARTLRPSWKEVDLTLLDRLDLVSEQTRQGYRALGWRVRVECVDALTWAGSQGLSRYDLCLANLFLHHFDDAHLAALLRRMAAVTNALVACEPRRSGLARVGSHLVLFLGANKVTRGDAVKSVAAGFAGAELTAAWGERGGGDWIMAEFATGPFTHCFAAVRAKARSAENGHGV